MDGTAERFGLVLLIAATVATIARRWRLPYTVGPVVAGAVVGFAPIAQDWDLTRSLLFSALLPPLVFEAALIIKWKGLRANLTPILFLATIGLLVSAAVVTLGMMFGAGWPLGVAAVFGLLVLATDPVSVVASMKESKLGGRLRLLLESESLLNDGTAAVGFAVASAAVVGAAVTPVTVASDFIRMAGGGMVCGALVSALCLFLAGRSDDNLVETAFSVVCAFGSFFVAESLHTSGILATVVAGLVFGNLGHLGLADDKSEESLYSFWEFAAFLANSFVFLLDGCAIVAHACGRAARPHPDRHSAGARGSRDFGLWLGAFVSRLEAPNRDGPSTRDGVGRVAGGTVASPALGLPSDFPHVEQLRYTTFWVVAFSVLVQGLTIGPLMRRVTAVQGSTGGGNNA